MGENSIVLAFSGGGLRAAAFTHGTLLALQGIRTPGRRPARRRRRHQQRVVAAPRLCVLRALRARGPPGDSAKRCCFRGSKAVCGSRFSAPRTCRGSCRVASTSGRTSATCSTAKSSTVRRSRTSIGTRARPSASTRQTCTTGCPSRSSRPSSRSCGSDITRYPVADAVVPRRWPCRSSSRPSWCSTYPESCPPLPRELESLHILAEISHSLQAIDCALSAYRDGHVRYIKLADGGL